ncbi:hypothetical protein J2X02_000646 [Pseudoxanthomonas japonensis]|uniref:hypothetical protein n=1 Tax=Pseudoxanthomonas japonensis TaxID=69284 RepID=UPI00285514FC|nr:hypothetical protein [Pseudoxanthomonas japonensis]MDR7067829.1 hypothetical protein [Pseudoxanthomonas japonensis]
MECRHLLAPAAAAGLLLVAAARVRAEDAGAPRVLHVAGGDFPALVMVVPGEHAAYGLDAMPGCDRIRARRIDELAPGWRARVARVELDCEDTLADDERETLTAVSARAELHADRVQFAGQPVTEVRLMDSQRWGDHQYVLAVPFATAGPAIRRFVEDRCLARTLADETPAAACTMLQADDGYYLPAGDAGGIWIHADSEDAGRTLYVEAWAD